MTIEEAIKNIKKINFIVRNEKEERDVVPCLQALKMAIEKVDHLGNKNRGGLGSTGRK